MDRNLLVLAYAGASPTFATAPIHAGPGAAVLGRATVGRGAWFGAGAVVRADGHYVEIGDDFRIGARGTVHIAHDVYPTHIGNGVTAGVNAIIHACDVGDRCHIGDDAIILDGSTIGDEVVLAKGAVVFPRSSLEGGWLYEGAPAKPVRISPTPRATARAYRLRASMAQNRRSSRSRNNAAVSPVTSRS